MEVLKPIYYMLLEILPIICFVIMMIIIYKGEKKENQQESKIDYTMYYKKNSIMTQSEKIFFKNLQKEINELELMIFPQVNLERIINAKNKQNKYRNRIKSRSIDYTIVDKELNIICCIELDDNSHKRNDRIKRDSFINELFEQTKIKLIRVKLTNNINYKNIVKEIKKG